MPIAVQPSRTGMQGCRVTGTIVASGGQIEISCENGGLFGGAVYGTQPIPLTADGTKLTGGKIDVLLPPSSAVGRYILRVGRRLFRFRVPDAESADLNELIEEARS